MTGLRGVFAAAVTPLLTGGTELDEPGIGHMADFLAGGGVDGALVCGTAGEGMLLTLSERKRAVETYLAAAGSRFAIMAHCGAQSTADTAALAAHAAEAGAVGVSVIAPPYFPLDERALLEHLAAAAGACAPLPFYIYAFTARSGYPIPLPVIERLGERVSNLAGLKVSEAPWERFEPYLIEGLDIFVGPEALIDRGLAGGAIGAISALASALPELVTAAVRTGTPEATARAAEARRTIERFAAPAGLKTVCALRGVAIQTAVRAPLRELDEGERGELSQALRGLLDAVPA
ncbi:MAG TPA: dihydrodipicolinate synthase family protein [Gaiellales bacterium]|nr:dihydrodipicolinate synthase family protein [Gaiellales bacterium]